MFETMSQLAREHHAVNLGQGFPEDRGPDRLRRLAADYLVDGDNQYPSMLGLPSLRRAVAEHDRRFYGLDVDPQTEVLVTSGATEALFTSMMGLLEAGDEVVVLEPAYDVFVPVIRQLGAIPRIVRLEPPDWSLSREALAAAFTPRTKLLLLNSPMNPIGKVFSRDDLELVASLLIEHDALAVCDEVYEHVIHSGVRHVPLMALPGMRDRCVRIGSAGKTFSVTGWKVGYVVGPESLLRPIIGAHKLVTFSTPPNLQHAVAIGLGLDDAYYHELANSLDHSRDRLAAGLEALGIPTLPGRGTYFLVLDVAHLMRPDEDDLAFCRRLTVDGGVTLIPMSAFHAAGPSHTLARACFFKTDATLDEALVRLRRFVS